MTRQEYKKKAIESYRDYLAHEEFTSVGSSIRKIPQITVLGKNIVQGKFISREMADFLSDNSNRGFIPRNVRSGNHGVVDFVSVVRRSQERREQYLAERHEIERGIPIRRRLYLGASQW